MAERKNSGARSAATGRSRSKSGAAKPRSKKAAELEAQRIRDEQMKRSLKQRRITSVILFAVGIVLTLLAIIPGTQGWNALYGVIHGLFGVGAYLTGPLMIFSAVVISMQKTHSTIVFTVVKCVLFLLMFCAALEIFGVGKINGESFGELCANLYKGGVEFRGGGFFAIVLGVPLLFLGKLGAGIIIIVVALVCVFLMTNMSLGELWQRLSGSARKVGTAVSERRRETAQRRAVTDAEYSRIQTERTEGRQKEQERRKILREIDEQQRRKEQQERLRRTMESADANKAGNSAPEAAEAPQKAEEPAKPVQQPRQPVLSAKDPAPVKPAPEAQTEADFRDELKKYMEKRHPIMREDDKDKPDRLEDADAELVPILDALKRFNDDHSAPARVSKIIDAPKSGVTDSDALKPRVEDISTEDEAELPFDIDDIVPEKPAEEHIIPINQMKFPKREEQPAPPAQPAKPQREPEQVHLSELYTLPPMSLLNPVKQRVPQADIDKEIRGNADKLVETLKSFGVSTTYTGASRGPSVTRYDLQPAPGVKISKIANLADDIALNLAASGVRIAPVPDKAAVGIEIPNDHRDTVFFRELVDTDEFRKTFDKKLVSVLGKDISGNTVTCNVSKMPHLLIAGTTGSGKSVCVNSIIMSILMKSTPQEVRLIMVDPKQVEFMMYNGIPHLLIPVVTDPKKAAGALAWSVTEMENRYSLFSENNVRNIDGYNALADEPGSALERMPHIVIFIDELADLMMASPKDVEDSIVRLAQKARAAGMHLVIATQKPTVQVVTGLIKGNIPSRIALMVASQIDSRVILDASGAEKLLGNGDMLYCPVGAQKPIRLQGCYVSDDEVERVVEYIKQSFTVEYDENIMAEIERQTEIANSSDKSAPEEEDDGEADEKLEEAIELVVSAGQASTSALQRNLKLGYGRAARLIDTMEKMGVVGPFEGAKPRQVLMTKQEWYERKLRG